MSTRHIEYSRRKSSTLRSWIVSILLACLLLSIAKPARAQGSFNSGSTGADGPFAPAQNVTVQIPDSGVFNFTTINIPANVTVKFGRNARNTPVIILATGAVTIAGKIDVSGEDSSSYFGGKGGPGGFRGGNGGVFLGSDGGAVIGPFAGSSGEGPGAGGAGIGSPDGREVGEGGGGGFFVQGGNGNFTRGGRGGQRYGARALLPLIGGSGGGGGSSSQNLWGAGGSGGGGAILIASSGSITFANSAAIIANGGNIPRLGSPGPASGGSGSGGAIRLVANSISGNPALSVSGGGVGFYCCGASATGAGSSGYIRVEGGNCDAANGCTGFSPNVTGPITFDKPNPAQLANTPQLRIVSVAGINAPAIPKGSFYAQPDIVVPTTVTNPAPVALQANNLPIGTVLQITLTKETGEVAVVNSTPLAGTQASSTATASVTLPASGIAVIGAMVTLNVLVAYGQPMFIEGERVNKVEIAAAFGGGSEVTYITDSGRRLKAPQ